MPISISDDDHEPNTDHKELLLPVVSPASFYSEPSMSQSHLQEFRCIRAEQDAEYERMLAIDSVSTLFNLLLCLYQILQTTVLAEEPLVTNPIDGDDLVK